MRAALPAVLALALAVPALPACKDRGTRTIRLDLDGGCPAVAEATQAQVYALLGRGCGDCACGGCVTSCTTDDGSCLVACPGTFCDLSALDEGIQILPFQAGDYAVIFQYVSTGDAGIPHVVGGACAQVSIQSDGTESSESVAQVECCAP